MPTLDPFYYLYNFESAIAWISQHSADLLSSEENEFLAHFAGLPQTSRALLVRMIMRKGPLFRSNRLDYPEIGDIGQSAQPLIEHGLIHADPILTLTEMFTLHSIHELRGIFGASWICGSHRKQELLTALSTAHPESKTYSQWRQHPGQTNEPASPDQGPPIHPDRVHPDRVSPDRVSPDRVYLLQVRELCDRIRLIFFGNMYQTWSEFIVADLGLLRYEHVPFSPGSRAFRHRDDVNTYLSLQSVRHALHEGPVCAGGLPEDAPLSTLLEFALRINTDNAWLSQRRAKTLFHLGQTAERQQDWETAGQAYAACAWPGARHRRIRVLERQGSTLEALTLALNCLHLPKNEAESQRVQRMLPRLQRLCQPCSPKSPLRRTPTRVIPTIRVTLPCSAGKASVEYAVQAHLHHEQSPVYYVENTLINSLFGLLCWDAIFAPLPGAFFHPFQRGPADLNAPDFSTRRATLFSQCLGRLDDGSYRRVMQDCFNDKQGIQSPFVFWGAMSVPLLSLALKCLPAQHLKLWFTRLLDDIATNRSGLPDLIRFFPQESRYDMIEVKGPGDRLQDNQLRWLNFFLTHQMPVSVCHVQWQDER